MNRRFYFSCPICQKMQLVKTDKKQNKPYLMCNDCGVQLFVRGRNGINRFAELVGKSIPKSDSHSLLNDLDYFKALKDRLDQLESETPILGEDKDLELEKKIIRRQLAKLRKNMEKIDSE